MSREDLFLPLWERVGKSLAEEYGFSPDDVNKAIERMKVPFRDAHSNDEFMDINFNDLLNCVGYTLRVATCHSILTTSAAEKFFLYLPTNIKCSLLNKRNIKIASIGGGPGSDLMGFLQVLQEKRADYSKSNMNVTATIFDYFLGWEEIVYKLRKVVYDGFQHLRKNTNLEIYFKQIDLRNNFYHIFPDLDALKSADVILMVKVLSVLHDCCGRRILKNVLRCMNPGSMLIFIDLQADVVVELAHEFAPLHVIIGPTYRTTVTTQLDWQQNVMTQSSYELCVVHHIGQPEPEKQDYTFPSL